MPRFSKHNDAVRYDVRWKFNSYTAKDLNDLCDAIAATSGYRMIVWDTFGIQNKDAILKINLEGEWRDETVD